MPMKEVLEYLEYMGFVDVMLPFILVFALTYGILQRTEVLGKERNVIAMTSFVFGFLAVAATTMLEVVNLIAGYFVVLLIVGLLFGLLIGMTGLQEYKKSWKALGGALMVVLLLLAFSALAQTGVINADRFISTLLVPLVILIALIGSVIYVLMPEKEDKESKTTPEKPQSQKPTYDIGKDKIEDVKKRGKPTTVLEP